MVLYIYIILNIKKKRSLNVELLTDAPSLVALMAERQDLSILLALHVFVVLATAEA